ncbi:MAG: DNA alkylation repair protein [Muribaculaceae bacterium]|nr:DNA alkylation repair protein [Muribaculaceae bacterium]
MTNVEIWKAELAAKAKPEKIKVFVNFFKTGKGEYGEGDKFIGLSVPDNRAVAKTKWASGYYEIAEMLESEIHEHRLSALLCLVEKYRKLKKDRTAREELIDFYLDHAKRANNWDLVDLSAPYTIGEWCVENSDFSTLYRLSESANLWEQRIAIVATVAAIRKGIFGPTISIAEKYLSHPHELIHKATGWMLREMGKRDIKELRNFLDRHADSMPRTALRYAIERMDEAERKHYLASKTKKNAENTEK